MLKSRLCDYSNQYIAIKGTTAVTNYGTAAAPNKRNNKVVFKNSAPFTDHITELINTQIDKANDTDVVMNMYNLIENCENCLQTSGSLTFLLIVIPLFHLNIKNVIGATGNDGRKNTS